MAKWFHKCSLEWLQSRQKFLTATDIKDLLPVTKTGRKRVVDDESYLKVLARKVVKLTEDDCLSTGYAARGHILEPYAIMKYNNWIGVGSSGYPLMYHWDDLIIAKPPATNGGLAFSPDAMNIPMDSPIVVHDAVVSSFPGKVTAIAEVKSYGAEKHFIAGYSNKMDLEERWQIATAMAVLDDIEDAHLLFFNPSVSDQLFIHSYDREDLKDEIAIVLDIEQNWFAWLSNLDIASADVVKGNYGTEQAIIAEIVDRESLDPDGFKSVIV